MTPRTREAQSAQPRTDENGGSAPIAIVSADTHIGPLLVAQLRGYCPKKHLGVFDEYASHCEAQVRADSSVPDYIAETSSFRAGVANRESAGHHDMDVRLGEMDADGVAGEVIFHGSSNGQPIPFQAPSTDVGRGLPADSELAAVGLHIYNQWLADVCSIQRERHAGLAYLPMWDVDAAVEELEWARGAGLRGVNFPAMKTDLPPYNSRVWEPLWRACESLEMPLTTHGGRASPAAIDGVEAAPLRMFEEVHVFGYRAIHWMVFAGVFERHPGLKLVLTESGSDWFGRYLAVVDDAWRGARWYPGFRQQVPRPPSEYCMQNVYLGASFVARFEVEAAVRDGYAGRVMWGSDYPHNEGTWQNGYAHNGETATHLALRNTFAGTPEEVVRTMTGQTATDVYGFDAAALSAVAVRIQAPTPDDLAVPPSEIPEDLRTYSYAFRTKGSFT